MSSVKQLDYSGLSLLGKSMAKAGALKWTNRRGWRWRKWHPLCWVTFAIGIPVAMLVGVVVYPYLLLTRGGF